MKIDGYNDIERKLDKIPEEIEKLNRSKFEKFGEEILNESKKNTPVDTGNLINSHYTELDGDDKLEVGNEADYAAAVNNTPKNYNNGRSGFFTDAVWKNIDKFRDYAQSLWDDMEKKL